MMARAALLFCCGALFATSITADQTPSLMTETIVMADETAEGATYWRVRSLDKVPLEGWVLSKIQFFTSRDGTGDAASGEPIASSYRGSSDVPANTEFKVEHAFDGSEDTVWESEDGEPGQWIGIKFAEKTDIKSIVMRTPDMVKGPSGCLIEKSDDGENWGRVAEITNMMDWGIKDQLYMFVPMDLLPPSVFAIRSQKDTAFCIGVRSRKEDPEDEDSATIHIEEGAVLELQKCLDDTITQWWSFDVNRGLLHNAKDEIYIAHVDGDLAASTSLNITKCADGCPELKNDELMYSDSVKGGFLRSRTVNNLVFTPKGGEFKEGTEVILDTCGDDPNVPASLDTCGDKKESQFELLPMFALEKGRRAVNCAPYSHTLADPSPATSRQEAQRMCAADIKCSAYNWVDGTGADMQDKVFICYKLHDVEPGQEGWELGIRAGRAYDSPYKIRSALM